ncbi:MAG: ribbon-helix-helix protein, CopG family [Alphaproteobacteria bacterium]|nr:ribbon-helix-helix protein, CopG family [Alphaproteobacteria bacterium]
MRTLVDIPTNDMKELTRRSKAEKRSRASLIRDAISAYLKKPSAEKEVPGFGLWKDYPIDGVEYQRKIRSEW